MVDRLDAFLFHGDQLHQPSDVLRFSASNYGTIPSNAYGPGQDSWCVSDLICGHLASRRHLS